MKSVFLAILLIGAVSAFAQNTVPKKSADLPEEISQFAFVIGEWDAHVVWKGADGSTGETDATWRCEWLAGGYMVHQNWDGPYLKGSEFRAWDKKQKKWLGHNFYGGRQWAHTECKFEDGNMIVFITGVSDKRGDFINRETYYDIQADSFSLKSERSYDGGKTWEPGRYHVTAVRKK